MYVDAFLHHLRHFLWNSAASCPTHMVVSDYPGNEGECMCIPWYSRFHGVCVSIRQKLGHRGNVWITEEERKHLVDMVTDWKAGLKERANQNESEVVWRGQTERSWEREEGQYETGVGVCVHVRVHVCMRVCVGGGAGSFVSFPSCCPLPLVCVPMRRFCKRELNPLAVFSHTHTHTYTAMQFVCPEHTLMQGT